MHKLFISRVLLIFTHIALAICAGLVSVPACSQAIDRVDIERRGETTVLIVRFITNVQYLRHAPAGSGTSVRIYVQFTGGGVEPPDLAPSTQNFPKQANAPGFRLSFPEPDGALLVTFGQRVKFNVRSGSDGRSVIILLPRNSKK